ncbi:MAG TPA: S-layer homology domain-containing protein [Chloroflexia bacterium]|jgi:hypothetical protein
MLSIPHHPPLSPSHKGKSTLRSGDGVAPGIVKPVSTGTPGVFSTPASPKSGGSSGASDAPVTFQLDDGTRENQVAFTEDSTEYAALWLNRFTPSSSSFPITLQSISVFWPPSSSGGTLVGKQATLLVYRDADGDNGPSNATLVGQQLITIGSLQTFETYNVNMTIPGPGGDIYVGFENTYARDGYSPALYSASIDTTQSQQRSWVVANADNSPPDINNLGSNDQLGLIDSFGMPGNWMIRAYDQGGTGATPTTTFVPAGATATASATSLPAAGSFVLFSDVRESDYFYIPVSYLASQAIISGYTDATFRPSNTSTRAQVVKIVGKAFAIPTYTPPDGNYTFSDVPTSSVYFGVIEAANHAGIINGYGCGGSGEPCDVANRPYFRPNREVSRGQLCKIVAIGANWTLLDPPNATFADVARGSTFYQFVETAVSKGIISGYTCGGLGEPCDELHRRYFRGSGNALRGHLAKIVYSALPAPSRAVNWLNIYRNIASLPLLQIHPSIQAATQYHANYYLLNHNDPSAMTYGPHGEVEGKPSYTGRWPSDRIRAAGFEWWGGAEVMHFIGEPVAGVDGWMSTIYHRVIMLDVKARYTGYGSGSQQEGNGRQAVDVMDFGEGPPEPTTPTPFPLAYPVDNQINVPPEWDGGESPDPLPPGAQRPVGYPFTLQGERGVLHVDAAELRTSSGDLVPTHPNPPDCPSFNCYALIAISPLQPHTTYIVHARGTIQQLAFDRTWRFTTGSLPASPSYPALPANTPSVLIEQP